MGRDRLVDQIAQTIWRIEEEDDPKLIAVWWDGLRHHEREGYRSAARSVLAVVEPLLAEKDKARELLSRIGAQSCTFSEDLEDIEAFLAASSPVYSTT